MELPPTRYNEIRKHFSLICDYCNFSFKDRKSKSRHKRMNRCEAKKRHDKLFGIVDQPNKKHKQNAGTTTGQLNETNVFDPDAEAK